MAKRPRTPKAPNDAVRHGLFAHEERERRIDGMGDPLAVLERHIDFAAIGEEVDAAAPRPSQERGGRPPYPTEVMVRILALKHLYNLADEALEFQLLDRLSFQRFCGLVDSSNIHDRTTVWHFEQRRQHPRAGLGEQGRLRRRRRDARECAPDARALRPRGELLLRRAQ